MSQRLPRKNALTKGTLLSKGITGPILLYNNWKTVQDRIYVSIIN